MINWQEVIIAVTTTVGGGGVLLGVAGYLFKTALTHRLTQETEAFKVRLKASNDAEVERLKHSLQMTAQEHQIRFSKLYERRAEIIAELYRRLVDVSAEGKLFVLTTGGSPQDPEQFERCNAAIQNNYELMRFIERHRIYIPTRACELLDGYIHALNLAVIDMQVYSAIENPNPRILQEKSEVFRKAYLAVADDIPKMKQTLDIEFRAILGERQEPSVS